MEAKPTYHLPPNFSTPPPPRGPFHLGTVLQDFEEKEQMRPLNQGEAQRIAIPEKYSDWKKEFTATRKRMKSGELGVWARFVGLYGVGGEVSASAERSDSDQYEFGSVETEFFYPTPKYISDCLKLSAVADYLKGGRYAEPVYLITGIKVGKGVVVRMERKTNVQGNIEAGINTGNAKVGPKAEGESEDEPVFNFTESSDIVVGIQCWKIYHENSYWLFGKRRVKSEVATSGATFYGSDGKEPEEGLIEYFAVGPEGYNSTTLESHVEGDECWMIPKEPEAQVS